MDRERLIRILRDYPGITHVSTKSGALALKFADGTTVDMNPNLAKPITPGETEAECVDRVLRSIAIRPRTPGMGNTGGLALSHTSPLVRGADYFMSFGPAAPIALSWITDFVGFGLAIDQPGMRCVINEPLLPADHDKFDALQLQSQAIDNLHALVPTIVTEQTGLGPGVLVVSQPTGSETAWFADGRAMGRLLSDLENPAPTALTVPEAETGTWVVIPASRHRLYLVNTAVPNEIWDKLVRELEFTQCRTPLCPTGGWNGGRSPQRIGGNNWAWCGLPPNSGSTKPRRNSSRKNPVAAGMTAATTPSPPTVFTWCRTSPGRSHSCPRQRRPPAFPSPTWWCSNATGWWRSCPGRKPPGNSRTS